MPQLVAFCVCLRGSFSFSLFSEREEKSGKLIKIEKILCWMYGMFSLLLAASDILSSIAGVVRDVQQILLIGNFCELRERQSLNKEM